MGLSSWRSLRIYEATFHISQPHRNGAETRFFLFFFCFIWREKQQQIVIGAVDDGDNPRGGAANGERYRLISRVGAFRSVGAGGGWLLKTGARRRDNGRGVVDVCG